ncbi:arf-GAP with coiled-coil, ANK repeat and PH domain-containing protein 2-like isoform X2 [Tubulanus polymorphus]|uniref:arf-GAP with coiled-coil, ANK repeat and PH domain-containing protein 2-like isoform X2 n=1 Tax=Tubulanus polymorphus TaxID=672921 RepID=UPI003DA47346
MYPNIDFNECLKDSPKFRSSLEESEESVDKLELKLDKLVKLCNVMVDTGRAYNTANGNFVKGVKEVSEYFKGDGFVTDALKRFTHDLSEIQKYNNILLDQAQRSVSRNINDFVKVEIKKVKETRKHFEKISDDMDQALIKHSQAPKSKTQECEETNNILTAMRSCFWHTSLDYVFQLNVLHSKKRFDILSTMLSFMHAQNTYFHQGYDLFTDLEPYMKGIASQIEELVTKSNNDRKQMDGRHTLVKKKEAALSAPIQSPEIDKNGDIKMEGYLFKKTTNAFKSWVRRWFMIQDNKLVYRKRGKDNLTIMEEDLRLCTVKPAYEIDRRYCFEVIAPGRYHMLQADSEKECQMWINAIQAAVSKAYRDHSRSMSDHEDHEEPQSVSTADEPSTSSDSPTTEATMRIGKKSRLASILQIGGNEMCCDCQAENPRWSSMNLGITLCIECSGIHRSFGVHMSKVRSLTLDAWEPEQLKVMSELGNTVVNRIYEANVDETIAKRAASDSSREIREAWIRAKYIQKSFVQKLPVRTPEKSPEQSHQPRPGRKWSVYKRRRRSGSRSKQSPAKTLTPTDNRSESPDEKTSPDRFVDASSVVDDEDARLADESQIHSSNKPDPSSLQLTLGESEDSGLGGSTQDVIVFGSASKPDESVTRNMDLESSEESVSSDVEVDRKSTTSLEDVTSLNPNMLLYRAAEARNLPVMLEALAHSASPNWNNPADEDRTSIVQAVKSGSLSACEFLILNGAKLNVKDQQGQTPLHHATLLGHTGQVCQFLKRGANQHAVNGEGFDPLAIAMNSADADIVTLLRLAKLNEEMKETEGLFGTPGDATFNDVFRDFTNMASNDPEKLMMRRKSFTSAPEPENAGT